MHMLGAMPKGYARGIETAVKSDFVPRHTFNST